MAKAAQFLQDVLLVILYLLCICGTGLDANQLEGLSVSRSSWTALMWFLEQHRYRRRKRRRRRLAQCHDGGADFPAFPRQ